MSCSTPTLCQGDPDDVRSDTDRDPGAVHDLPVYDLQERLAEPKRQEQQRIMDLEVFDSLQWQLHQLGKQAQMLNCVLNEQHLAQETLESELLEQMETFKGVHNSWTLLQDQIVQKRGELQRIPCVPQADWQNRHWLGPAAVSGEFGRHQHPFRIGQFGARHAKD